VSILDRKTMEGMTKSFEDVVELVKSKVDTKKAFVERADIRFHRDKEEPYTRKTTVTITLVELEWKTP